ncbi:MAG TPA: type II secretion system protein [Phycisphaerae bacterium]|nr:type II secretion system protein [Phycisphaerae bacterium]
MTLAHPHLRRRGYTLVELIVASSIMAVLLIAVQSTIMLAAHAIPGANTKATALVNASAALEMLNADVAYATAVTTRTASSITLQVPDRNGDGNPETVTWSWNQTAGGNLSRTFNTDPPVVIASNVQSFALAYDTRSVLVPGPSVTSAEVLLSSATALIGTNDQVVDNNHNYAEFIFPTLPANATSWAITRVQLNAKYVGAPLGYTNVQVQTIGPSDAPSGTVLDTAQISEANLTSTNAWTQVTFSNATGLAPTTGACIVVAWVNDAQSISLKGQNTAVANNIFFTSPSSGTWNANNNQALQHYIYGTYTTPGTPIPTYYLTGVRATLLTSADTGATTRIAIHLLNEPQVTGP